MPGEPGLKLSRVSVIQSSELFFSSGSFKGPNGSRSILSAMRVALIYRRVSSTLVCQKILLVLNKGVWEKVCVFPVHCSNGLMHVSFIFI